MPIYTDLPTKYQGELRLARQLEALGDREAHLWFGVKLPGVNDIDILLYHEKAGVFCIEVKAVPLGAILEFGYNRCHIQGRPIDDGPHHQAFKARDAILNFLKSNYRFRGEKMGYVKSTACWPIIRRADWRHHWDNPAINEMAEQMLFEEDVTSGRQVLIERLNCIAANPPVGPGLRFDFKYNPRHLQALKEALDERGKANAAPSDLEKLRVIEAVVTKETLSHAPIGASSRCIYSGYPGTGKTFRLLQIGLYHSLAGKRVLFLCYNKTLAADIRRLLSYSDKLDMADAVPDVYDVYLDCTPKVRQKVKVVYSERKATDYEPQTSHLYQRLQAASAARSAGGQVHRPGRP